MAEIEFQIDGFHDPCRETEWTTAGPQPCMSTERVIAHVPNNFGKKLLCGRGHNQRPDKPFIPGYEFDNGGAFEGVVPPEFLPSTQSMRDSRWKIPQDAPIRDIEADVCAICEIPPCDLYRGPDVTTAFPWLQKHAPELVAEIHTQVARRPGAMLADWPSYVDTDLQRRIRERLDLSCLEIDHAVPKKVGNDMWPFLTAPERRVLQVTLLIKVCKRCNLTKSKKLVPRETVEKWYADVYFDGDRAAAVADVVRWRVIDRTLSKIYEQRSVG